MIADKDLDLYLTTVAETLDLPPSMYGKAVERYEALGAWLQEAEAPAARRPAEVYPQGSARLGTAIRPLTDADTLDIDLVYERDRAKSGITQAQLKAEAGDLIKGFVRANEEHPDLEEKSRCWTLVYDDVFHMDALPALPDAERGGSAILITDRGLSRWQNSDPKAYANWFWQRMKVEADEERRRLFAEAKVEQVPDWRIKTTLQRVVQILKRHRDLRFQQDPDDKPASIILTTLAARAYQRQPGLHAALTVVLRDMANHVEKRDGVWWIPNPVHEQENFADRWRSEPQRAEKFFRWIEQAQNDFAALRGAADARRLGDMLRPIVGSGIINEADSRISTAAEPVTHLAVLTEGTVPGLADASHAAKPAWPFALDGTKVRIEGHAFRGVREGSELWRISPNREVGKGLGLRFTAKTNAKQPHQIHWQVVNTGREAGDQGGLRGGFESGEGASGSIRWESTSYRGTHWIEAFVVRDGRVVARSGRFHVRIR